MIKISWIKLFTNNLRKQFYHNEPIIFFAKIIDQRIKGTLGITG